MYIKANTIYTIDIQIYGNILCLPYLFFETAHPHLAKNMANSIHEAGYTDIKG